MARVGTSWRRAASVLVFALLAGLAHAGTFASHDRVLGLQPRDATGGRTPVILLHGWGFGNVLTFTALRARLVEEVEAGPEPGAFEVYEYSYDHTRPYGELARELVADVEGLLGANADPAARRPVLVGYSAGGLLGRYAMDEPGFGARVAGLVTVVTPLHGCLGATMLFAGEALREDLGEEAWATIEETRADMEFEAHREVLGTLGFDNLGPPGPGGEPRDLLPHGLLARWGLADKVNQRLRRINLEGRWDHKLYPHMGRNPVFETMRKPELGRRQRALQRAILGAYAAVPAEYEGDADPIVALYSGVLAFRRAPTPLGDEPRLYEGMTHINGAVRAEVQEAIVGQLRVIRGGGPVAREDAAAAPSFADLFGVAGD